MLNESPTISVTAENDDLVLDVTGNSGHRVPDRNHLGVDYWGEKYQLLLVMNFPQCVPSLAILIT